MFEYPLGQEDRESSLDRLEHFLLTAGVRYPAARPYPGSRMMAVLLEGGALAVAKRKGDGDRGVRCEVAAWKTARTLGWTHLLLATVLRLLPPAPGETPVGHAVRLDVPGMHTREPLKRFPRPLVLQAAVFDYLILTTDRHGGNWLATELSSGDLHLVLIDHEHAFDLHGRPFSSEIFDALKGELIPDDVKQAVARLTDAAAVAGSGLGGFLSGTSLGRLESRAKRVLRAKRLADLGA